MRHSGDALGVVPGEPLELLGIGAQSESLLAQLGPDLEGGVLAVIRSESGLRCQPGQQQTPHPAHQGEVANDCGKAGCGEVGAALEELVVPAVHDHEIGLELEDLSQHQSHAVRRPGVGARIEYLDLPVRQGTREGVGESHRVALARGVGPASARR